MLQSHSAPLMVNYIYKSTVVQGSLNMDEFCEPIKGEHSAVYPPLCSCTHHRSAMLRVLYAFSKLSSPISSSYLVEAGLLRSSFYMGRCYSLQRGCRPPLMGSRLA